MNTLLGTSFCLAQEMAPRLFDLDFQLIADSILTIIAVFFLFLFLSYFLFKPVRKMLTGRTDKIRNELEEAAEAQEEANRLRLEYEGKLKEIDKEAERILADARRKALDNEARIVADARKEAAGILDRARSEAELEKKKAADDVKKEIVKVASAMAGKIMKADMSPAIQSRLVDETLQEIGESTWLS